MPTSTVQFPPESTGPRLRTYRRGALTSADHDWVRVFGVARRVTYLAAVSTFRTVGAGANNLNAYTQVLFTIEVAIDAAVAVAVRRLSILTDITIAQTSQMGQFQTYRLVALPTGGTVLAPAPFDSTQTGSGSVTVRGATGSDGGVLSEPSVSLGTLLWQQFSHRLHSLTTVGESKADDNSLLPLIAERDPVVLAPGEALCVQYSGPNNGWRSTSHGIVKAVYEEILL